MSLRNTLLASALISLAAGLQVPANLQSFYNDLTKPGAGCKNKLGEGFYSLYGGQADTNYCGDHLDDWGIVYLQGDNGQLSDMDIDCDGSESSWPDDRCAKSDSRQDKTSFMDKVSTFSSGAIKDVNSYHIPYVVFGNEGGPGWNTFDPEKIQPAGMERLSVMAVVCNGQLVFGVWADENGSNMNHAMVGEASIGLASKCFPSEGLNGKKGHGEKDVLYIGFPGQEAVVGPKADWGANDFDKFHKSLEEIGNKLVAKIGGGSSGGGNQPDYTAPATKTAAAPATEKTAAAKVPANNLLVQTCAWPGHCEGATCTTHNDCSDELACLSSKCSKPQAAKRWFQFSA